jgi:hypothetical protein
MKLYSSSSETVILAPDLPGFLFNHNGDAIHFGNDRSQFRHNMLKLPK